MASKTKKPRGVQVPPGWLWLSKAVLYAGVSDKTFCDWLKGGLPFSRLPSGRVIVQISDIDNYLLGFRVKDPKGLDLDKLVDEALEGVI